MKFSITFISKACVLFCSSAVKFHDSQAYRNMKRTRERNSFTFVSRDMLLFLQIGFNFVKDAAAWAILERTSGFEPPSRTSAPKYLKLVTVTLHDQVEPYSNQGFRLWSTYRRERDELRQALLCSRYTMNGQLIFINLIKN